MTSDKLEAECRRGQVLIGLADQVVRTAALKLQAAKIASDHGLDPTPYLLAIPKQVEDGNS